MGRENSVSLSIVATQFEPPSYIEEDNLSTRDKACEFILSPTCPLIYLEDSLYIVCVILCYSYSNNNYYRCI